MIPCRHEPVSLLSGYRWCTFNSLPCQTTRPAGEAIHRPTDSFDSQPPAESQRRAEQRVAIWAAAWFFFVLLSYSVVRPVRETMGAIGGTKQLQGLMLVTFAAMLIAVPIYASLVNRLPRRWLVRVVFHFFSVSLLAFSASLSFGDEWVRVWAARTFFIWVNVFGLFATSVFWSVLADLFSSEQGKRLFGRIAAGGTVGAVTGSLLTSQVATEFSTAGLLLIPMVTLQAGLWCAWRLEKRVAIDPHFAPKRTPRDPDQTPTVGGLWEGVTHVLQSSYLASICVFLFFVQAAGTQLYFQQAEIVGASVPDDQSKTQLFAYIDFATQVLTLTAQLVLSGWMLRRLGVGVSLMVLPLIYLISFSVLSFDGSLVVVATAMVVTRAAGYGITVPAREVLFTVVSRKDKYKSKSFIDTVVLRGGDAISSQVLGSLRNLAGFGFATLNLWTLPIMAVWTYAAFRLGRRQQQLAARQDENVSDTLLAN
ncbi:NTP/NDP exchange transporter [Stieleria magnilauensis]|uniref:Major Facilitator Superfamily protein n=1 Tax=Stieleria magnilauensis TaxID=2527963 RepID=A0ABX5XHI1_9BACT|nr:Major Facilitator Superfamily protein [Planctomycetes bacterium TBK1r]